MKLNFISAQFSGFTVRGVIVLKDIINVGVCVGGEDDVHAGVFLYGRLEWWVGNNAMHYIRKKFNYRDCRIQFRERHTKWGPLRGRRLGCDHVREMMMR